MTNKTTTPTKPASQEEAAELRAEIESLADLARAHHDAWRREASANEAILDERDALAAKLLAAMEGLEKIKNEYSNSSAEECRQEAQRTIKYITKLS